MTTFEVATRGIGRKDYSTAIEKSSEPVITGWQSLYSYHKDIALWANSWNIEDIAVPLAQVVFIYDVWCTIPSNRLQRLILQGVDSVGAIETIIDVTRFQTIHEVFLKGFPFLNTIRVITYNYANEIENYQHIALLGMYSSLEEYGKFD